MLDKQMIGTWRLHAFRFTDENGKPGRKEDAPKTGRIEYTTDGHMATATEQSDGSYFSYFGDFEIKENEVFHHIELASNPALVGTTTVRSVSFEEELLVLTATPPVFGKPGSKASLVWKKIKNFHIGK